MLTKICFVAFSLALISAEVDRRQLPTCTNAFQLTTNPCASGAGRTYYPVPNDNTKFIQCDIFGGAYVVQCPSGLVYNQATNSCQKPQTVVAPTQPAANNPCTAQAITGGTIYFTFPGDSQKFYQCTGIGQLSVLQCPNNLVWSQARISCVLPQGTVAVAPIQQQSIQNPCTPQQLATKSLYFAHPSPNKFIQCDLSGNAYEMDCPTGLVWNQYLEVCASAFQQGVVGRR